MKLILSFLKPYHIQIAFAYTLTFIELAAELLFPLFLGIVINKGIIPEDTNELYFWGGLMLVVSVLAFLAGICNSYFASHISTSTGYDIREKMFSTIQRFSFDVLNMYPTSMIVTRFTNDVRIIQNTVFMSLRIMVKAPLMVIGSVTMAFIINPTISLIFIVIVPILVFFLYWVLQKGSAMFTQVQEHIDSVNQVIQENIAGMRIIKAFVRRDFENNRFHTSNDQLATKTQTAFRFVEATMPILLFVMNVSLLFILWVGNKQSLSGAASVGDVVSIVNYALRTVMMISMFTFIALAFSRAKASGERIHTILTEKTSNKSQPENNKRQIVDGRITFQHLSFSYPNSSTPTLSNLNFTVDKGETIAIMGATGSGKTTLFQLIPALYYPTSGGLFIDDMAIETYDPKNIRNSIGCVSQNPLLFTGTIADNIRFGKEDATTEEIIKATKTAQIHESILTFQEQYHAVVGQKGVNLSGGQKQRLSIARALIRKPKILMLDDSTSALDMATEIKLLDGLDQYDCTVLIITQKVSTARRADRILIMDNGEIVAKGSHNFLMKESSIYQQIVASQVEKEHDHAD